MNSVSRQTCIKNGNFRAVKHSQSRRLCRGCSSDEFVRKSQGKKLDRALRVLDILSPKPRVTSDHNNHLRLIQGFLLTESAELSARRSGDDFGVRIPSEEISNDFDRRLESFVLNKEVSRSLKSESELETKRFAIDACDLSYALSSCGSNRNLSKGLQYHCLSIRSGFVSNVYVGSCLINLYGKCGELENAYKVFNEMPEKNVVSWTAIIAGFAQEWRIDMCLELFSMMRNSDSEPNDFTFTSVLSACTGSGALGRGRSFHCQTIQAGFHSYVHISNALISMYCKCGSLGDAFRIFNSMSNRDIVSWNSMIAGYAHHGLASQAIELFEETKRNRIKPDAITFLGVLSSCRHVGLVNKGKLYFESMAEFGVNPDLDHYACLVDLLSRFGLLNEALELIESMPVQANAVIWGSLLSSCRVHGDVWTGIRAAEMRLILKPECAATHIQLANLYASVGFWDKAARVRKLMKERGLRTNPGYSWIEIKNDVFRFRAEDRVNSRVSDVIDVVDCLVDHMRGLGYMPAVQEEEGLEEGLLC